MQAFPLVWYKYSTKNNAFLNRVVEVIVTKWNKGVVGVATNSRGYGSGTQYWKDPEARPECENRATLVAADVARVEKAKENVLAYLRSCVADWDSKQTPPDVAAVYQSDRVIAATQVQANSVTDEVNSHTTRELRALLEILGPSGQPEQGTPAPRPDDVALMVRVLTLRVVKMDEILKKAGVSNLKKNKKKKKRKPRSS